MFDGIIGSEVSPGVSLTLAFTGSNLDYDSVFLASALDYRMLSAGVSSCSSGASLTKTGFMPRKKRGALC